MQTNLPNCCICVNGTSASQFSVFITDKLPIVSHVGLQVFPLKLYEENTKNNEDLFNNDIQDSLNYTPENRYTVKDGITNYALQHFSYDNQNITKKDIFYYVYGILHHPNYQNKYSNNLIKDLPHIPKVENYDDFIAFSQAGRELAELHINYEKVEKYPVRFKYSISNLNDTDFYCNKMKFAIQGKQKDKTTIIYNDKIIMQEIPLEAYQYKTNGYSPIEWIVNKYQVKNNKDTQITNDPNDWSNKTAHIPMYIVELIQRVINVSLKTNTIIKNLPKLDF